MTPDHALVVDAPALAGPPPPLLRARKRRITFSVSSGSETSA